MGKASRWFKGLLGMKNSNSSNSNTNSNSSSSSCSFSNENRDFNNKRDKKRWSFGKSTRDSSVLSQIPVNVLSNNNKNNILKDEESVWLKSYMSETEKEQNKHAIAVAAATAAAADAAVAAAQAAVTVVRLTSNGRRTGGSEWWASVKIQTFFRGYLARKALRALKGLVKLQALVKGYLVRKRTAATLHSMQALIRAQTSVRSQRIRRSMNKDSVYISEIRGRKSIERYDDSRSEYHSKRFFTSLELNSFDGSPKIVEIDTYKPRSRSRRINVATSSEFSDDIPYLAMSSPFPCPVLAKTSLPNYRHPDFEWCFNGDECRFSTAQSTPRFINSVRSNAPVTPSKSVCGEACFRTDSNYPNYMASTQSFKAKLRSHSAPKQRPEPVPKKWMSLNDIMASRNSISTIRMQRPVHEEEEEEESYDC